MSSRVTHPTRRRTIARLTTASSSRTFPGQSSPSRVAIASRSTPRWRGRAGGPVDLAAEVLHEERDVLTTVAQRRHLEHRVPEPVVEVLAEGALLDRGLEIAMGRRDDAHIDA